MAKLVVIEGLDGAGKRTLADAVITALRGRGLRVISRAFPRYGASVHADLVSDALHGRLGDLTESVYGMCLLFALDRREAADTVRADLAANDVVLLDRYVASNAAYGAARLREDAGGGFVDWVRALEIDRFELPVPDTHILLRVPAELAARRAAGRERADAGRVRDSYESDDDLQSRCARVYEQLAAREWLAPWHVVDGTDTVDGAALAAAVLDGR